MAASTPPESRSLSLDLLKMEIDQLKRHLHITGSPSKSVPLSVDSFGLDYPNFCYSEPFYTQPCGYKLCLRVEIAARGNGSLAFSIQACLMKGEFDSELEWPVKAKVTVQIQDLTPEANHIRRSKTISWQYKCNGDPLPIPVMTDVEVATLKGTLANPSKYLADGGRVCLQVKYMQLEK